MSESPFPTCLLSAPALRRHRTMEENTSVVMTAALRADRGCLALDALERGDG